MLFDMESFVHTSEYNMQILNSHESYLFSGLRPSTSKHIDEAVNQDKSTVSCLFLKIPSRSRLFLQYGWSELTEGDSTSIEISF